MIFKKLKKFSFKFRKLFLLFLLLIISSALFLLGERKNTQNIKEAQACWDAPEPPPPSSSSSSGCAGVGCGGACGNSY